MPDQLSEKIVQKIAIWISAVDDCDLTVVLRFNMKYSSAHIESRQVGRSQCVSDFPM